MLCTLAICFGTSSNFSVKPRKKYLSTEWTRKVFNSLSHLGPATSLLVIVLFVSNEDKKETLTLAMFTLAVACMGALYSGFITNPQDIAPNFAGGSSEQPS